MSTYPTTAIFSIDSPSRDMLENFKIFCIAEGLTSDDIKPLVGCYKGKQEPSFLIEKAKFDRIIRDSGFVDGQESILIVSGCNKAYATLEFLDGVTPDESLGSMCNVSEDAAMTYDAWTFRPDINRWYICAHENPDHARDIPKA